MVPTVQKRDARQPEVPNSFGSHGFAVIRFKFVTIRGMEDPLQFASKIGVHYPLAVATEDVKQRFRGSEGLPTTIIYERQGIRRTKVVGMVHRQHRASLEAASEEVGGLCRRSFLAYVGNVRF